LRRERQEQLQRLAIASPDGPCVRVPALLGVSGGFVLGDQLGRRAELAQLVDALAIERAARPERLAAARPMPRRVR